LLALCGFFFSVWLGLRWLRQEGFVELAKVRQWGDVVVIPEGFASEGWLHYRWNRITILSPLGEFQLVQPSLRFRLASAPPFREHVRLQLDSLRIMLSGTQEQDSTQPLAIPFPEFRIPLRSLVEIQHMHLSVPRAGVWQIDSLLLRNPKSRIAILEVKKAQGTHLANPLQVQLECNWANTLPSLEMILHGGGDSLWAAVSAPRANVAEIGGELQLYSQHPKAWIPLDLRTSLPKFGSVSLHAQFQSHLLKPELRWSARLRAEHDAYQILPKGKAELVGRGTLQYTEGNLQWQGSPGQRIEAEWLVRGPRDMQGSGKIQGLTILLADQSMPLDGEIHHASWKGDQLQLELSTQAGSHIVANGKTKPHLHTEFTADISPSEPWALAWCAGNLQLAPPARIQGEYALGVLQASVQAIVPFAYQATAEHFSTDLRLDSMGVSFHNGHFVTRTMDHQFHGKVQWGGIQPHFTFEVQQDSGGRAVIFGDFDANISLNVSQLPTWSLPLADTTLLQGIRARVTGNWEHQFPIEQGKLRLTLETQYRELPIDIQLQARQNGDSLLLESLQAHSGGNVLYGSLAALLTPQNSPPLVLLQAKLHTEGFALPTLLQGLGDSSLSQAHLQGQMVWDHVTGLQGSLLVDTLLLRHIPADAFRITRILLEGKQDKLSASARIHGGRDGLWNSEAQILAQDLFQSRRRLSAALAMDYGGIAWIEGTLDSLRYWKGNAQLQGNWELPGQGSELRHVNAKAYTEMDLQDGLPGARVSLSLDSAIFATSSLQIPLRLEASLVSQLLKVRDLRIQGQDSTFLRAQLAYHLDSNQLQELRIWSPQFHLRVDSIHQIRLHKIEAQAKQNPDNMELHLQIPAIMYDLLDTSLGHARALLSADLLANLPLRSPHQNPRISGRIEVQKASYQKNFRIFDWRQIRELLRDLSHKVRPWSRTKQPATSSNAKIRPSTPQGQGADLDIRILDPGSDSLFLATDLAQFPITLDLQLQGTTTSPLLNGDISAAGPGSIGMERLAKLDLQSLRIHWLDAPPKDGEIDMTATTTVPMCERSADGIAETCPVQLALTGPLLQPTPTPSAQCGVEASPAQIYYALVILGCFPATDASGSMNLNAIVNQALSTAISEGLKMGLSDQYVGEIGLKWRLYGNSGSPDLQDSNYIFIPFKLDRWVKNLSLVMGYTKDVSEVPTYDQSYSVGLKYSLPVLDSNESIPNHIDPTLDFSGNLIAKRYSETGQEASRLEKNIETRYSWQFWKFCPWGLGVCEDER
jgi:hypothetical protein